MTDSSQQKVSDDFDIDTFSPIYRKYCKYKPKEEKKIPNETPNGIPNEILGGITVSIIPPMAYHEYHTWTIKEKKRLGIPNVDFGQEYQMCMCKEGHSWDPRTLPVYDYCPWC
jgi:hypothetical protein